MFFRVTNLIKINLNYKKKMFKTKLNKNDLTLIRIFIKINIIKYIKKYENNNYIVYLNYFNEKPVFNNIINMYKPSQLVYISWKNLMYLTKTKNWLMIVSTDRGLITNYEAVNKKKGGLIITKIWN